MTDQLYICLCERWGCEWNTSSYDYDRVCERAQEHNAMGNGHAGFMLNEPDE